MQATTPIELDATVIDSTVSNDHVEAQTISEQRRETIKQVIGTLAEDVMSSITDLRRQLDDLEKLVLANAARVSENLNDHVQIAGSVGQEVARISSVVSELRRGQKQAELLKLEQ